MGMIKRQNEKKKNPMGINNGSNDDTIDVTNKVKANGVPEIYFKISDIYLTWNIFSLTVLITYTTVVAIAFFFFYSNTWAFVHTVIPTHRLSLFYSFVFAGLVPSSSN